MGGLEVRNKALRCEKCLDIKRLTIFPEYPEPILKMECRCTEKNSKLFAFLTEYKKKEIFVIKCSKCQNVKPKEPKYCYRCQKIYCIECSDFHEQLSNIDTEKEGEEQDNNITNNIFLGLGHKVVSLGNLDYQCIIHSSETYVAFCKKCSLNICQKCINEDIHKDHDVTFFSDILLDHKKKEIITGCLALCQDKISHNEKISKKIKKKIKNEENKKLISTLSKENKKINESILEFFYLMNDVYERSKNMNYSIIFNARKNTAFNVRKINFEKKDNEEEDALVLIEYFKNDFILETDFSRKKRQEEKKHQKENNEIQEKETHKEIVINDSKIVDKSSAVNDKFKNEIEIEEEKIEGDKIIETKGKIIVEEEIKKEANKEEVNLTKIKKEELKREEIKEEVKKEEVNLILKKEEEIRDEEPKKEEIKIEIKPEGKAKGEEVKTEKNKLEETKKEEIKKEEIKKEEIKEDKNEKIKIEIKKEEVKEEELKKKENKIEKIKKEEVIIKKENKPKEKKEIIIEKEKKEEKKKDDNKEKTSSKPLSSIESKANLFKKMMEAKLGGMKGHLASNNKNSTGNQENTVKVEQIKNEGNTIEILNNIKVTKVAKKKPKKINFE